MSPAPARTPVALTVAGSDSGGGAGIQADLKTFHSLGVFGTSVITCVTAQNPRRLTAVFPLPPRLVSEQMARVFEAFPIASAKTGLLYNAALIEAVADGFRRRRLRRLVVDPVLVATSGRQLLEPGAVAVLGQVLIPLAELVTPNRFEAEVLGQRQIRSLADMRVAARALADRFGVPFLIKGGHLPQTARAVDVLFDGHQLVEFSSARILRRRTHGTGCAFSAAIAAQRALGHDLIESIRRAKRFVREAIRDRLRIGTYDALNL